MMKQLWLVAILTATLALETSAEETTTAFTEPSLEKKAVITPAKIENPNTKLGFYLGVKGSKTEMEVDAYGESVNIGLYGGYQILSWLAVEAEYSHKINSNDFSYYEINGEYNYDTLAVYATFKTRNRVYFKGRVGYATQRVLHKVESSFYSVSDEGHVNYNGLALSSGLGVNIAQSLALEAEMTVLTSSDNTSLVYSLGVKYKF